MLWGKWEEINKPPVTTIENKTTYEKNTDVPKSDLAKTEEKKEAASATTLNKGQRIKVITDVVEAEIDLNGGDLRRYSLLKQKSDKDKSKPFVLFADEEPHNFIAQSGLIGQGLPNHKEIFTTDRNTYQLATNTENLEVKLHWRSVNGIQVDKVYIFKRNSYVVQIKYEITNNSSTAISPDAYFQFLRDGTPPEGHSALLPTYAGPAIYTEEKRFQKHEFSKVGKDGKDIEEDANNGWIAVLQHYFLTAYLPQGNAQRKFYLKKIADNLYTSGVIIPVGEIATKSTKNIKMELFAGPLEQESIKNLAPGLELAVDYGWLKIIAVPIFTLMSLIHKLLGNWGWTIIVLTIVIKMAFYPLSAASYRSMAKMKALAPRLQRLKEQYGDDRQKQHQAMMDIYKTEKINPLGGCLPVVIQIPVFIALYWVLLYSVEMRQAPFALWIHDLTAQDPYYVLPVLMGISMLVQARLNPTPPDPIQAKIMMIMPVAFSIMFFWFPAGLVLYWVVNNVLSIAQQWRINHVLQNVPKKAKR